MLLSAWRKKAPMQIKTRDVQNTLRIRKEKCAVSLCRRHDAVISYKYKRSSKKQYHKII